MYDKDGRFIYYPSNFKKGYVIDDKSLIDKVSKSYFKLFFFNVKGFNKDIEEIFKNCEVVDTPLPYNTRFKNIAKEFPFWILLLTFAINCYLLVYMYKQFNYVFAMILLFPIYINIKQLYVKLCK